MGSFEGLTSCYAVGAVWLPLCVLTLMLLTRREGVWMTEKLEDEGGFPNISWEEADRMAREQTAMPPRANDGPSRFLILLFVGLGVLLLIVLACGALIYPFHSSSESIARAKDKVDMFMQAMASQDIAAAYALLSPKAQEQISIEALEAWASPPNDVLFQGYQRLELVQGEVGYHVGKLTGKAVSLRAVVYYDDGTQGNLTAVLQWVDDDWAIYSVYVVVPPEKFNH